MKNLEQFVNEQNTFKAFRINQDNKPDQYFYHPKNKDELRKIIEERLEEDPNADLNDIDVSKITDMFKLFSELDPHNIDISGWNVSNVKNMNSMFSCCRNFKGNGIENWDVKNLEQAIQMFENCENFDCDLSKWNTFNLQNASGMFFRCDNFTGKGLEKWNVSNLTWLSMMFYACKKFNCNLNRWNLKHLNARSMTNMFWGCNSLENYPSWYKE